MEVKNRKYLSSLLIILLLVSGCSNKKVEATSEVVVETPASVVVETKETSELKEVSYTKDLKDLWDKNYEINNDYIGQVYFKSGLLNQPVTYYSNNEYYLRKNFETLKYDIYGTVFADFECSPSSQNIILYGHYVSESYDPNAATIMFTPLAKLLDESNYKDNDVVYLLLENQLRIYEVVSVFYCDLYKEDGLWYPNSDLIYYYADYDKEYFEKYKASIKEVEQYDTGVDFSYNDSFLTLQTCVEKRDDLREIVLCKQIGTVYYEE